MIKNIIFDLDGTLVDTAPDILCCLKNSYKICDLKIIGKLDKYVIGPAISEIVTKLSPNISEQQLNSIIANYRSCYDNSSFSKSKTYNNIDLFLKNSVNKGYRLFVATNKPIIPTNKLLRNLKLIKYFDGIFTPDMFSEKRLTKVEMIATVIKRGNLKPQETIFVGDGVSDIIAGQKNDILVLALSSGYTKKDELLKANPDWLMTSHNQMIKLLENLIECK